MGSAWHRMKRYSLSGWRHRSTLLFCLLLLGVVTISVMNSPPFWVTFTSLLPVLVLYFPLVGFCREILERDWEDWHLW